jgi:hypothetical protein
MLGHIIYFITIGFVIYDDKIKENLLNKYCCSISFVDDTNHVPPDIPSRTDALLSNIYITERDVKDILQTLKIGKACGDDGITRQMLKSTSETICIPLAIIFNFALYFNFLISPSCQTLSKAFEMSQNIKIVDNRSSKF